MPNIEEVPLPYHTRVVQMVDETGEIEVETMNELGQWARKRMDQVAFQVFSNSSSDTFWSTLNVDYDEPLIVCSQPDTLDCAHCPCREPHYSWECNSCEGAECQPLAHEEYGDIDDLYDEYHPVLIQDCIPGSYGDISPRTAAHVVRELLERGKGSLIMEKFGGNLKNNFVDSRLTGKKETISFRRYGNVGQEKSNSQGEAASWQDTDGTWHSVAQGQEQVFKKGEA